MSEIVTLIGIVSELLREIRAIRMAVERSPSQKSAEANLELLAVLLPAIAGKVGSSLFLIREMLQDPAILTLVEGRTAGTLGGLFAACADATPQPGLTVERCGHDHGTTLWRIVRVLGEGPQLSLTREPVNRKPAHVVSIAR